MVPPEKIAEISIDNNELFVNLYSHGAFVTIRTLNVSEVKAYIRLSFAQHEKLNEDGYLSYRYTTKATNVVRTFSISLGSEYEDDLMQMANEIADVIMNPVVDTTQKKPTDPKIDLLDRVSQETDDVIMDLTNDRFDTIQRFNDLFRPVADQLTKVMMFDHATDQGKVSFFKVVDRDAHFIAHMDVEDLPGINRIGDVTDECSEVLNTIFDSKPDFYYVLADTISQRTNDKATVRSTNPELFDIVTNDNEGNLICTIKATFYGWYIVEPSGITIARYHNALDNNYEYSLSLANTLDIINKSL